MEKVLDSINRNSQRKLFRYHGIPEIMINIVMCQNKPGSRCALYCKALTSDLLN